MSQTDVQTPKGFRDFAPEEAKNLEVLIAKLQEVFSSFGFVPLQTPALEFAQTLKDKYGEEEKLIYEFADRGGRMLALRFDQTVPLARYVAQNPSITIPFKRYQIGPAWRAESPQKGRFREFWQADIDTVGVQGLSADVDVAACAVKAAQDLGLFDFKIQVNDRVQLQKTYEQFIKPKIKTSSSSLTSFASSVDKLEKIGPDLVIDELVQKGIPKQAATQALSYLLDLKNSDEAQTDDLKTFLQLARSANIDQFCQIQPTLARGLDYYTGLIFEMKVANYTGGSVGGGGRYDNLIGTFTKPPAGGQIPAVGFSFGLDRLLEAQEEQNVKLSQPQVTILIAFFDQAYQNDCLKTATILRQNNLAVELYLAPDKLEKQIKYASAKNIPYLLIIGPQEEKQQKVTLKNLQTQFQETITVEETIQKIKASDQ